MKVFTATLATLLLIAASSAQGQQAKAEQGLKPMLPPDGIRTVAPALEKYTQSRLLGEVWKRPGLSPRDRSIVTLAALIARDQTIEMPYYVNLALDNGVTPREISEIITHLAFYSGWANAISAVAVAKDVFARRGIGADQLPAASPQLLPLDEAAEAQRAARVGEAFGQVAQISYHLNRAMDNGLTQAQASEVITHLAFYVGWLNAFSALLVAKDVFEKRAR